MLIGPPRSDSHVTGQQRVSNRFIFRSGRDTGDADLRYGDLTVSYRFWPKKHRDFRIDRRWRAKTNSRQVSKNFQFPIVRILRFVRPLARRFLLDLLLLVRSWIVYYLLLVKRAWFDYRRFHLGENWLGQSVVKEAFEFPDPSLISCAGLTYVENILFQNCYIFSILRIFKYNKIGKTNDKFSTSQ